MIKILHVIPSLGTGGCEKILLEICRSLRSPHFEHRVVALKSGGRTADALQSIPVPVKVLNSADGFWPGIFDFPRVIRGVEAEIREHFPDIVQTWLSRANVAGRIAARSAHAKKTVSALRVMESEKSYHLWAERWTQKYANVVTVNCTALKDFAVKAIGIPENKIVLIPNGIDVPAASSEPPKNSVPVIGTLGRLHSQKAVDVFLKAAKKVLERRPDCRFIIGGEGPEEKNLKALAMQLGIQEKVEFAGLVTDSGAFFSKLDVFVLASRWEGMPNVILEAMARKVPVAATAVGGTTDLIRDGKEGLLAPSEAPDALAEAVLQLVEKPDLRKKFAEAAYGRARSEFSMDMMIERYRRFYESLAA